MRRLLAGLFLAAAISTQAAAETSLDRLLGLGLPTAEGSITLHYSLSARAPALHYARELERAIAWYRAELGWQGEVTMAVLDEEDWTSVTPSIPYPSPHTERSTGLVIMADRIDSHAGFDRWDLDPLEANASLIFHEVGHLIARQVGLWSGNRWVNEFVANVFLAAYVRAAAPDYGKILAGVPPRFADAGKYTALVDFDDLHFGIGQLNYAWFQFKLMALADFLVEGAGFAETIGRLRREFPVEDENVTRTLAETLARMERVKPGFAAAASDLVIESAVPKLAPAACGPETEAAPDEAMLVVDNFSGAPLALNTVQRIDVLLRAAQRRGRIPKDADLGCLAEEALLADTYAVIVEPGGHTVLPTAPGRQWHIVGGNCFTIPPDHARLVWTGGAFPPGP